MAHCYKNRQQKSDDWNKSVYRKLLMKRLHGTKTGAISEASQTFGIGHRMEILPPTLEEDAPSSDASSGTLRFNQPHLI